MRSGTELCQLLRILLLMRETTKHKINEQIDPELLFLVTLQSAKPTRNITIVHILNFNLKEFL